MIFKYIPNNDLPYAVKSPLLSKIDWKFLIISSCFLAILFLFLQIAKTRKASSYLSDGGGRDEIYIALLSFYQSDFRKVEVRWELGWVRN